MFDLSQITLETDIQHIEYHETLESTNQLAAELSDSLRSLSPALVLTARQTAGRGRGSNAWQATRGALTFSVVLDRADIRLPDARLPQVSLAAGLAVRNTIAEHVTGGCLVKWPNDVLLNEQKICGILTEQHAVTDGRILVVGIGVNVNNSLAATAAEFRTAATSVFDATGQSTDLTAFLIVLLQQLTECLAGLCDRPREFFARLNRYSQLNGRHVEIDDGARTLCGRCLGIDDDGRLLLEDNHTHHRVIAGTVVRW